MFRVSGLYSTLEVYVGTYCSRSISESEYLNCLKGGTDPHWDTQTLHSSSKTTTCKHFGSTVRWVCQIPAFHCGVFYCVLSSGVHQPHLFVQPPKRYLVITIRFILENRTPVLVFLLSHHLSTPLIISCITSLLSPPLTLSLSSATIILVRRLPSKTFFLDETTS